MAFYFEGYLETKKKEKQKKRKKLKVKEKKAPFFCPTASTLENLRAAEEENTFKTNLLSVFI